MCSFCSMQRPRDNNHEQDLMCWGVEVFYEWHLLQHDFQNSVRHNWHDYSKTSWNWIFATGNLLPPVRIDTKYLNQFFVHSVSCMMLLSYLLLMHSAVFPTISYHQSLFCNPLDYRLSISTTRSDATILCFTSQPYAYCFPCLSVAWPWALESTKARGFKWAKTSTLWFMRQGGCCENQ